MGFESSSNKFNKANAVRRKRIGSFISSEVVSRQKDADSNQLVLNQRVYNIAGQEDDKSFYEDNLENEYDNELSAVVNEAVVPQQLNHRKQFEKKYLVSSTEVRRSSNLKAEDNENNRIVHNTSSFTYISHVKHEERVVPLNVNSNLTTTVSRTPDEKTLPSTLKSLPNGLCYEPNFSFGMDDMYDATSRFCNATSRFAQNEGNPNFKEPSKWQQYLSVENESNPFLNTNWKNIEQPVYEYTGPSFCKKSKYMVNKHEFHEMYSSFSGQSFENEIENYKQCTDNQRHKSIAINHVLRKSSSSKNELSNCKKLKSFSTCNSLPQDVHDLGENSKNLTNS